MQATHLERFWAHFRAGPLPPAQLEVVLPQALAVGAHWLITGAHGLLNGARGLMTGAHGDGAHDVCS